ncbi:MAG TPA: YedE-related selenium metabolism membrane protein [Firmicutes bacterium]|nr:YedE-related selenium metabolism membrane protein [Bacillota bacterium]
MNQKKVVLMAGAVVGALSVLLMKAGNPANMGICVACFIRDIAGALGMHRAEVVQYIRPEVPGFILGSFLVALAGGEFRARGGSSPLVRFVLGFFVVLGALVFLGCPLRMVLRLAGGDLNALTGLAGFAVGIWIGLFFLRNGFSLGRSTKLQSSNGYVLPAVAVALLLLLLMAPAFIFFSEKGPGSMRAPWLLALVAGVIVGAVAQRSRLCLAGGIRDLFLIGDPHLFRGFVMIFVVALVLNMMVGPFKLGFVEQPVAHSDGLWNFLGMVLVGLGSVLLGGCPLRQCILAGEGDADAGITFLGMLTGGAFAHNFSIAASPTGVTPTGKLAVFIGIVVVAVIGYLNMPRTVATGTKEGKQHAIQS